MAAELVFGAARLPTVPEEIAPWLAEHFDCDLASVEHTRAIYATASKLFYTIHLSESSSTDQPRPYHVCVKGGFDPKVVAAYPWLSLIYRREVEFFNRIAPSLKHLELPKVWWAGHDSKTQGILIMDDLNALGCTYGSPTEAWSVEMVYTGIEQLAALHAGTWGVKTEDFPCTYRIGILFFSLSSLSSCSFICRNSPGMAQARHVSAAPWHSLQTL